MIAVSGDLLKMFHVKQTYGGSNEKNVPRETF